MSNHEIPFNKYGASENVHVRLSLDFLASAVNHAMEIGFKGAEYRTALQLALENYDKAVDEDFKADK